jgi:hypothetical protein
MQKIVLGGAVLAFAAVLFVVSERKAAPRSIGITTPSETAIRSVRVSRYWSSPRVNEQCRNVCEPHCEQRWGLSTWVYPLRQGCFLNCVDVACEAR